MLLNESTSKELLPKRPLAGVGVEPEGRRDVSATLSFIAFFETEPQSWKKFTGVLFLGADTDGQGKADAELLTTLFKIDFFSPEPLGLPEKKHSDVYE